MNQYHMQQIPYGVPPPQGMGPPPPPQQPQNDGPPPQKKQRISRACDRCNQRSTKCIPRDDGLAGCQTCLNHGKPCTNDRPAKKRGMKPKETLPTSRDGESDAKLLLDLVNGGDGNMNGLDEREKWKRLVVENEVLGLVDAYVELVHPVYPLFHIPTLRRQMQAREYLKDGSFFAELMSLCALSAVKASDKVLEGPWSPYFRDCQQILSPDLFFAAAESCLPQNIGALSSFGWMRTCALLALYGLHVNKVEVLHQYLGIYLSIVTLNGFHDEKNWPVDGVVEVEMRRRLFWSMYTLDVYTSVVFGNIIRHRADRTNVSDPSEVDDDFISDLGYNPPGYLAPFFTNKTFIDPMCWIYGWNFNTEIYRILESCINNIPYKRPNARVQTHSPNPNHENDILCTVIPQYEALDAKFKNYKALQHSSLDDFTQDTLPNRFEIQAANITTTVQLIRMVLINSPSSTNTSTEDKHAMATSLIDVFAQIPSMAQKVISTPHLHHFAGIAALLNEVMQGPISDVRCRQIRHDLSVLGTLTSNHEASLPNPILAGNIYTKMRLITTCIESPHHQVPPPQMASPTPDPEDDVIDPGLNNNLDGNNNVHAGSGNEKNERNGNVVVQKRYNLLTAGGVSGLSEKRAVEFGREEDLKGSEYVYFLLPREVLGWGWDVGRGFGRS